MVEQTSASRAPGRRGLAQDDYGRTPAGIGGYLILLLGFLAASAIGLSLFLYLAIGAITELWPLWPTLVRVMVGIHLLLLVLFVIAPIGLIFLALKKLEIFPGLCIIWIWAIPAVGILWQIAVRFAPEGYFGGTGLLGGLAGLFVVLALIVTSYLNGSARAENTFVR